MINVKQNYAFLDRMTDSQRVTRCTHKKFKVATVGKIQRKCYCQNKEDFLSDEAAEAARIAAIKLAEEEALKKEEEEEEKGEYSVWIYIGAIVVIIAALYGGYVLI